MQIKITIVDGEVSQDKHYDEMAIEELIAHITKMSYQQAKKELEDEVMYVEDLEKFFRRGRSTIYSWIKKGSLPQSTEFGCWSRSYLYDWLRQKMWIANAPPEELRGYDPKKVW